MQLRDITIGMAVLAPRAARDRRRRRVYLPGRVRDLERVNGEGWLVEVVLLVQSRGHVAHWYSPRELRAASSQGAEGG